MKVEEAVLGSPPNVSNEPYGFSGRKATFNHAHALVTVCPSYVSRHPMTLSSTPSSSSTIRMHAY